MPDPQAGSRSGLTPIRIGNASGFYGDRFAAMREMLEDGELDVLTGDYLAELTMLILGRDRLRDASLGYARTFLRQLEDCLGLALDRGVSIVANAGGLNPEGLAAAVHDLAGRLGLAPKIAYVHGDDLLPRAVELGLGDLGPGDPVAANAYLGGWGIAACLQAGANVVVTGRVTDASLVVGPAAAHFGWAADDFDALAGAMAAGHVIECGAQATGGNYSFFTEIADLRHPGFPIAEIYPDGSSVITKHPGTGGAVTVGTVTAQLLYEIAGPRYAGPDATLRLDTVQLRQDGADRVAITGVRGEPPPPTLKVSLNSLGGYRNQVEFVLTGLDIEAKAALVEDQLAGALPRRRAVGASPHRPCRRQHRGAGERHTALRGPGRRRQGDRPRILRRRGRACPRQLPGLSHDGPAGRCPAVRRVHRGLRRPGRSPADSGPARRPAGAGGRARHHAAARAGRARRGRAVDHRRASARACRSARWPARAAATRAATPTSASGQGTRRPGRGWPAR